MIKVSFGSLKLLGAFDAAAEKAHDAYAKYKDKYTVNVSWANDGIGYLVALDPKKETMEADVEERFFGTRHSLMPAPTL